MSTSDLVIDETRSERSIAATKQVKSLLCEPQANSTVIGTGQSESGYATKAYDATVLVSDKNVDFSEKGCNGEGILELDETLVEDRNSKGASPGMEHVVKKRQRQLTEKGKSYRLTQNVRERKKLKRELQTQIANIEALMGLDRNLELVSKESLRLNERFKVFGDLHEEIQELLTGEEQALDHLVYLNIHQEIVPFREAVQQWMVDTDRQIREEKEERISTKSSVKTRSSKSSRASSKAKAIEAKAKQAELEAKIAQLDQVEAARKEAERVRLEAECTVASAISKVYEDAIKEDEQYLGCDEPDSRDINTTEKSTAKARESSGPIASDIKLKPSFDPVEEQSKRALNPYAPEFAFSSTPLPRVDVNGGGSAVNPRMDQCKDDIMCNVEDVQLHVHPQLPQVEPLPSNTGTRCKPQATFWERMELRMSQPPPEPTPFDGDPARYLRFRANFGDQVESKKLLSDSEKMSFLMSYTTGRAKEVIERYQGLPNGFQLALQVLKQRFGQNAMIFQALKSSVIGGPKIRAGDSAALLTLSDELENCCWAMIELESDELDCTTNLRQIYDRLPGHLQGKWRKSAKLYRERTGGKEPTLKELSKFITAESQIENDPVYGRAIDTRTKFNANKNFKRPPPEEMTGTRIPTLSTEVHADEGGGNQEIKKPLSTSEDGGKRNYHSRDDLCKIGRRAHTIPKCSIFLSKSVAWRRRFARFKALCYRCLSPSHLQRKCPESKGCTEKDCARPLSHHSLLHVSTTSDIDDVRENADQSSPPETNLSVNSATMDKFRRTFVLLKVVPLRVITESGVAVTTLRSC